MSLTLKVIKSKNFKANDTDHTHYTCAYKGRVFSVSTMRFSEEAEGTIEVNNNILKINCDVEVMKNSSSDQLTGETKVYLDIVPKVDLNLAAF